MSDFILVWKDGASTVLSHDVFFHGTERPELSFSFDDLFCETPTDVYFRNLDGKQFTLTDEQIAECGEYCENFYENGDYGVYAYSPDDDNLYKGFLKKSECVEKGYKWVVDKRPETRAAAWDDEKGDWKVYYAAIMEDGFPAINIVDICKQCVLLFTREEWDALPKREHRTDSWDFEKDVWSDQRDLDYVKMTGTRDIRNRFEALRWEELREYVPDYERETWRIQLDEARAWLADSGVGTPYIDAFLAARTDSAIPTKQALCEDIIADNDEFVRLMAEQSAKFWSYKKRIQDCTTGYEVDEIVAEFNKISQV